MTTPQRQNLILPEQVLGASYDLWELGRGPYWDIGLLWCVGRWWKEVSLLALTGLLRSYLTPSRTATSATELYLIVRALYVTVCNEEGLCSERRKRKGGRHLDS